MMDEWDTYSYTIIPHLSLSLNVYKQALDFGGIELFNCFDLTWELNKSMRKHISW